jgi:hypothetical protein
MLIYEVIRWGCDHDRTHDTIFLVSAPGVEQAGEMADEILRNLPHANVPPYARYAQRICELGNDTRPGKSPAILLGPCFSHAYYFGWRKWEREDENGEWKQSDQ